MGDSMHGIECVCVHEHAWVLVSKNEAQFYVLYQFGPGKESDVLETRNVNLQL